MEQTPDGGRRTRAALAELRLDRLRVSPQPNVPFTPQLNVVITPQPNVPFTPQLNVVITPQPNVPFTPRAHNAPFTPQPNVPFTPHAHNVPFTPHAHNVPFTPHAHNVPAPTAPRAAALQPLGNTRERSPALPPGYLSPAASPDELLIQQRGRKRLPVTWSPDIDLKRQSFHSTVRTPPKLLPGRLSPPKLGPTLRSTPRKRLILDERIPLTPEKIDFSDISTPKKFKITSPVKGTPPIKRPRIEKTLEADFKSPIDMALKGLSPTQLIHVIKTITHKHPEIEKEIRMEMPAPDLAPLEERLTYLKSNIFKSLPSSRLTSKTDSPAYSRVATHLGAFKKCVIDQGKTLVDSQHWESVVKYAFLAWSYVRATPVWDHQPHNAARKQCFKALINFCMSALKKGSFDKDTLVDIQDKLQEMVADCEEIQSCVKHIQGQLQES